MLDTLHSTLDASDSFAAERALVHFVLCHVSRKHMCWSRSCLPAQQQFSCSASYSAHCRSLSCLQRGARAPSPPVRPTISHHTSLQTGLNKTRASPRAYMPSAVSPLHGPLLGVETRRCPIALPAPPGSTILLNGVFGPERHYIGLDPEQSSTRSESAGETPTRRRSRSPTPGRARRSGGGSRHVGRGTLRLREFPARYAQPCPPTQTRRLDARRVR